jgi:hypothetical protein
MYQSLFNAPIGYRTKGRRFIGAMIRYERRHGMNNSDIKARKAVTWNRLAVILDK